MIHGLRTPREELAFTARPKIHSHSQIFRYGRSIFCLPHLPKFSDIFDLSLHWVSVVRAPTYSDVFYGWSLRRNRTRRKWISAGRNTMQTCIQGLKYLRWTTYLTRILIGMYLLCISNANMKYTVLHLFAVWPVYNVKCLCSRGWEWGREGAIPNSISIFDYYGIKTLWFEFGSNIFTNFKIPWL